MTLSRGTVAVLCLAACGGGSATPAPQPTPTPAPTPPAPEPRRVEPARGLTIRYPRSGGGIARYAFGRRDSVVATMPSGETQVQLLGRTAFVTVTWVAADSGARITATVDSVIADSGVTGVQALFDSARTARWNAFRRPGGRLDQLTGGPKSLVADQVRDQLQLLFPLLPADGVQPGGSWSDSTSGPARLSAFEAVQTARSESHADALLTAAGALPIGVVLTRTATGEGTQFGQPMTLRATGADTLTYQLATDGRVLSVDGVRFTDLVVELPSIGQSVPARERSLLRMTLLR